MKKTIMFLGVLSLGLAQAQQNDPYTGKVGINTETPSATLNVKSLGDTDKTKSLELENSNGTKMVTVLDNGKVGIMNNSPEYALDIQSSSVADYPSSSIAIRAIRSGGPALFGVNLFRANGTLDAPQIPNLGTILGHFSTHAYTGTGYGMTSAIYTRVTGERENDDNSKASIMFKVNNGTLNGTNNDRYYTPEMILHHSGNLGIGLGSKYLSGLMPNFPLERLHVGGSIVIGNAYWRDRITEGALTPVPNGKEGTMIYSKGHFYGWVGENAGGWRQLDNIQITGATQLDGTEGIVCNEANRGKMNFKKGESGKSDVFGVCLKNTNGNYNWAYLIGGGNLTNGTGTFGNGLQ